LKVSAIIPTYNRRTRVLRAIDSVLAQTVPVDEIIVVDDGSTDGTVDAIHTQYGSQVTVVRQENGGVSVARTRAVEEARGEWVAFLDSDDVWLPTKMERQWDALATLGNEYRACFTNCNYFGNPELTLTAFEEAGLKTNSAFGEACNPIKYIAGSYLGIYVQSLIVLRSLFNEVNGFDQALGISEDRDLVFKLAFKTKFCFVATPLVSIDRTPLVPRLTGLLAHKDDQSYAWLELVRKKWLAQPELVDRDIRQTIQNELITLYYGRTAENISELKFAAAIQTIQQIRSMGQSYPEIGSTLLSRAAKKLSRKSRARVGKS